MLPELAASPNCAIARLQPMSTAQPISEERRREIFLALVDAQDRAMTVSESRQQVARQFEITELEVREIEREGLSSVWPPL
jgi:hypothetical protein